ncbi:uncharacterized protein LOC114358024 isoform X1 [Ostrinia furnacalis]|uniref:uncharacterized protein LOC114358024 isoform X1 n=1 Tax=Ostrinia furnacalis TaxID=93504 RepID=UPI00103A126A|nr:uncharacterized protein LOC114358024 isoform X1 [Ostrinia furnacalis]
MLRQTCSWVTSPLAVGLLLRACGNTEPAYDKFIQLSKRLTKKDGNTINSKIFVSSSSEETTKHGGFDSQGVDFRDSAERNAISDWVNEHAEEIMDSINTIFPKDTSMVLMNIHRFKDTWAGHVNGSPSMKVYNSFSYTQDVKYETRLLQLPTSGNFKLVLLVPKEVDVLHELFSTLCNEGLEAATNCLQPMFTTTTKLEAPSIHISSKITREQEFVINGVTATGQYFGNVKINENEVNINVLTCLYSTTEPSTSIETGGKVLISQEQPSFYFALCFKDTPIFIGQYYPS